MILLHRPLAGFGLVHVGPSTNQCISRDICIQHACLIARYIQDYRSAHGSTLSMSWIALHIIATASTTLVASVSDRPNAEKEGAQLSCLSVCLVALSELEKSHIPTRRVRRVIQQALRILDLDTKVQSAASLDTENNSDESSAYDLTLGSDASFTEHAQLLGSGSAMGPQNMIPSADTMFIFDEFLPPGSQTDMLREFDIMLQGNGDSDFFSF